MRLHLVRHGAHILPDGVLAGRLPGVHLSAHGRAQAASVARRLASVPLRAVYASPLERTRETAEIVAAPHGLAAVLLDGALEIDVGDWAGKSFAELETDIRWRRWNGARSLARCPGGESMAEAQARMVAAILALAERHRGDPVALVSHGDVIKAAVAWFLGLPLDLFQRIDIALASLSIVDLGEGAPVVRTVGEAPTMLP